MEEKQTGLSSDGETDFVRQFESAATFEPFLGQKNLNMSQKFSLILRRKPAEDRKTSRERQSPDRGNELCAQSPAASLLQKTEDHGGIIATSPRLKSYKRYRVNRE